MIITPYAVDRTPPEHFKDRLRAYDSRLYVQWNSRKERWVVCECIEHSPMAPSGWHHHLCRLSPFFLCQDEGGGYMPLDSAIFDRLNSMDVLRKYGSVENMVKAMDEIDRKAEEAGRKAVREGIQERKRENKDQLEKAVALMDRHDIWRVNQ